MRKPLPSANRDITGKAPRTRAKRPRTSSQYVSGADEPSPKKTRFDHQLKHPYTPYDLGKSYTLHNCNDSRKTFEDIVQSEPNIVTEEQYKGLDCLLFRDLQSEKSLGNLVSHVMAFSSLSKIGPRQTALQEEPRWVDVPLDAEDFAKQCRTFVAGFWDLQSRRPLTAIDQLRHYHTLYYSHTLFQKMKKDSEHIGLHPELDQWLRRFTGSPTTRVTRQVTVLNRALEAMLGFPHEVQTRGSTRLTRHLHKCETVYRFVEYLGGPGSLLLMIPPNAVRERKIHNV